MLRIFVEKFFNSYGRYVFKCRTPEVVFTEAMLNDIQEEMLAVSRLKLRDNELAFIKGIKYHSNAYGFLEFLKGYQLSLDYLKRFDIENGKLNIEFEGPVWQASMWEIPILAIVQEVYWRHKIPNIDEYSSKMDEGIEVLRTALRAALIDPFTLVEFGTRRRFSREYQVRVMKLLMEEYPQLFGTSNMFLAMAFNLKPCGTMAHEYICLGQSLKNVPVSESQVYMLEQWYELYGDSLGTALSDTLGTDKFIRDFTPRLAKLYDGIRHDSDCPYKWADRHIENFGNMGIDHKQKLMMFSDSLDIPKAVDINKYMRDKKDHTKTSFGIGTALTNGIPGIKALNNVYKLVEANGRPVAKIADGDGGKTMCQNDEYLNYLKWLIESGR